jgi:PAS domain S-box-containing protein
VKYLKGVQGAIYTADSQSQTLQFAGGFALEKIANLKHEIKFGDGILGQVAKSQKKFIVHDPKRFKASSSKVFLNIAGVLVVPLVYNYTTRGVLEVTFTKIPDDETVQIVETLAETIASYINALLNERELKKSLQEVKDSQERLKRFSEAVSEGIIFIDAKNKICEANDAFLKIFNCEHHQVLGAEITDFLMDKALSVNELATLTTGELAYTTQALRKDGKLLYVAIIFKKADFQSQTLDIVSFRDVTKQVETEENLKESKEKLAEAQGIVELSKIIERKNRNIVASITYAQRIQEAMLPSEEKIRSMLPESFVLFRPRDIVSGDFYWLSVLTDDHGKTEKVIIAAVDCTGHGVSGAFMSLLGINLLNEIVNVRSITQPDLILNELHKGIRQTLRQDETNTNDGMDMALCAIDLENSILEFAGAQNPLFYVQNGQAHFIKGDVMPIGGQQRETERLFTKHTIKLADEQGLRIPTAFYLYSDGYHDQFGEENSKKFGSRKLREFLFQIHHQSALAQKHLLQQTFEQWKGSTNQIDDVLVIGARI